MFQIALVERPRLVIGRTPPLTGSGSEKPWMPCLWARLPVAMLVQSIGESTGDRVERLPTTPLRASRSRWGMRPASSKGPITFQSAASQPSSNTLGAISARERTKNGF